MDAPRIQAVLSDRSVSIFLAELSDKIKPTLLRHARLKIRPYYLESESNSLALGSYTTR